MKELRGYSKILAVVCVAIMCATIFGNIAAGEGQNQDKHIDVFTDQNGNLHKVWRDKVDGVFQVFYANTIKDNNTGLGHGGLQITNSTSDVNYPQFTIDVASGYGYITWSIYSAEEQMWYCGSPDLIYWSDAWFGGIKESTEGNPNLDINADNYLIYVTWKQGGSLIIEPDCDGDFIIDKNEAYPFKYDHHSGMFNADAVAVDHELGISVAVDWEDDSDIKPVITPAIAYEPLIGSITQYVDVSLPEGNYTVVIKLKYSELSLPHYLNEGYLRIYAYDDAWRMIGDVKKIEGGVDFERGYVWAQTTKLSILTIADASATDLNNNGIADIWEATNTFDEDNRGSGRLTIYSESSVAPQIYISPNDEYHIAWIDYREGSPSIYYKRTTDYGETWTTDSPISTQCLSIPSMSFAGEGDHLALTYHSTYKTGPSIQSNIVVLESMDAGRSWNAIPILMSAGVNPAIAVYQNEIYVAYEKIVPSGGDIPQVYLEGLRLGWTEDGTVTSETIVYTESRAQHLVPKISVINDKIHIIWAGYFYEGIDKLFYIWKGIEDSSWSNIETISEYYGENDPYAISFAATEKSLYVVTTENRGDDPSNSLFFKVKNIENNIWSTERQLPEVGGSSSQCPHLIVDDSGVARIVWHEESEDSSDIYYMELSTFIEVENGFAIGESSGQSAVIGDYSLTRNSDGAYQSITEIEPAPIMYTAQSQQTHYGSCQGSLDATYECEDIYQVLSSGSSGLRHDWTIPVENIITDSIIELSIETRININQNYQVYYSRGGSDFILLGTFSNQVDNIHTFQLQSTSVISNGFIVSIRYEMVSLDTIFPSIYVDMVRIEITSNPGMALTHTWAMEVKNTGSTTNTFFIKGYKSTSNDDFAFSYSIDGNMFINMFVFDKVSDDGNYICFTLPSKIITNNIYICVTDSNRQVSDDAPDTLFVDHMYIKSIYDEIGTIISPVRISSDSSIYSEQPTMGRNSFGNMYVVWHDYSYDNYELIGITDATEASFQTSPITKILAETEDSAFSEETDFTMYSTSDVPTMHRSALISKLNLLTYMLSSEDYAAAYNKIEFDVKPYIEIAVVDESVKIDILTSVNRIGETIEPLAGGGSPPPTPTSIYVSEQGKSGILNIVWGTSSGATGYRIYRSILSGLTTTAHWKTNEKNSAIVYNWTSTTNAGITNSNLTDQTTYYYAVRAYNNYGWSDFCISPDNFGTPYGSPYVVSKSPVSSGVSIGANIEVTFNEPMNQSSVESAFSISPYVLGDNFTWSGNTMTWTHKYAFANSKVYTVKINGNAYSATWLYNTDKALDSDMDNIGEGSPTDDYIWSFNTVDQTNAPPVVVSTTPIGDQVPISSQITVTFSKAMDHATTQNAFSMYGIYSETIASNHFTYSWSADNKILTATPTTNLTHGQSYMIKILGTAREASSSQTLDGNTNKVSEGSPTDDWYGGPFKTPVPVSTPTLTATSEEFMLSWPTISNPGTSNPYEIYFSDSSSIWPTNPIMVTSSTTYVMDVTTYGGLYGLEPHRNYYFRVKAHNTAGCFGTSAHVGAECGRGDYFLDVGVYNANPYYYRDLPPDAMYMPRHGLTLPPENTDDANGWSQPVYSTDPVDWRQGTSDEHQKFLFNLGDGAELHIDYLLTFRYMASGSFHLQQKVGETESDWLSVGEINGHKGVWETTTIRIDHSNYYDYKYTFADGSWSGIDVMFRFSRLNVIYVDWIKAEPVAYHADIEKEDYANLDTHSSGVCLNLGDWGPPSDDSRYGNANSKFVLNIPDLSKKYFIHISYKTEVTGGTASVQQFDGSTYRNIGNLVSDSLNWHTDIIETNLLWYYDYTTEHNFFNVIFKFDIALKIKSISVRDHLDTDLDGIPDKWFAVPEWAPMDDLIMYWSVAPSSTVYMTTQIIKNSLPYVNYVTLLVFDSNYKVHAEERLSSLPLAEKIRYIIEPIGGNPFIRDYGPQFIMNQYDQRTLIDWGWGAGGSDLNKFPRFYYEYFQTELAEYRDKNDYQFDGGNFQTDGEGIGYTTHTYSNVLTEQYGLQNIRTVNKLYSDPNNHLDMIAFLASPNSVILPRIIESPYEEDYISVQHACNSYSSWGFEIFEVDTYITQQYIFTYTNALILNNIVFVPQYYEEDSSSPFNINELINLDANALQIFQNAFQEKTIIPIHVPPSVLTGQGSIHCMTLTRPAGG